MSLSEAILSLINVVLNECLNVEAWPIPAYGGWIYTSVSLP